jgi:hypothetical protein
LAAQLVTLALDRWVDDFSSNWMTRGSRRRSPKSGRAHPSAKFTGYKGDNRKGSLD